MNDTTTSELGEMTITRVHAAPIDLLFELMTTPAHLTHFWGGTGTHTPVDGIVVDLRPGGAFETRMVGDDGNGEYLMQAVFVEVERPTRLVWTEAGVEGGMTTSVTFRDLGDGTTEATTHQTNVPTAFLTPAARAGFESSLDRCDDYIATLTT